MKCRVAQKVVSEETLNPGESLLDDAVAHINTCIVCCAWYRATITNPVEDWVRENLAAYQKLLRVIIRHLEEPETAALIKRTRGTCAPSDRSQRIAIEVAHIVVRNQLYSETPTISLCESIYAGLEEVLQECKSGGEA